MSDVSVVIPTWNRAGTIEAAVRSALAQTVSPLEVLVCDDGSTDNTKEIVLSIDDSRVKWIEGVRGGRPAIPRNRGIALSKGQWLAFLDSDDEWLPDKLEKQLKLAEKLKCQAVSSNAWRRIPGVDVRNHLIDWNKEIITFNDLLVCNQVICSSAIVQRSLFEKAVGFPEDEGLKVGEDYALWMRIASFTDFAYLNMPLLLYSDDPVNSVRSESVGYWRERARVFGNYLNWAKPYCEDLKKHITRARQQYRLALWQTMKQKIKQTLKLLMVSDSKH